jgi:class 3 adenylate cyclase
MIIGDILWREPTFESDEERDYALAILELRELNVGRTYLFLSLLGPIPVLIMKGLGVIATPEAIVIGNFHVIQAVIAIIVLITKPRLKVLQYTVFWCLISGLLAWAAGGAIEVYNKNTNIAYAGTWIVLLLLGSAYLPLRSRWHNAVAVVALVTMLPIFSHYPDPNLGYILTFAVLGVGQNYRIYTQRMVKAAATHRYREQSRYIPRQVLMEAARTDRSSDEVFAPTTRFCVCICSDWRNFQKLTETIGTTELGQGLVTYYTDIVKMLNRKFPDGRFFVDWIADELFVVAFANDTAQDSNLVKSSFEFADEVLEYRQKYFESHGYPPGIDIGLASGLASVGIFGQEGVAKATAFGRPPAFARKLQEVAKGLRQKYSHRDRLAMNANFASMIYGGKASCTRLAIEESEAEGAPEDETQCFIWPRLDAQ